MCSGVEAAKFTANKLSKKMASNCYLISVGFEFYESFWKFYYFIMYCFWFLKILLLYICFYRFIRFD